MQIFTHYWQDLGKNILVTEENNYNLEDSHEYISYSLEYWQEEGFSYYGTVHLKKNHPPRLINLLEELSL